MMKLAKSLLLAAIVVGAGAAQTAELGSPMPQPAAVADYSTGACANARTCIGTAPRTGPRPRCLQPARVAGRQSADGAWRGAAADPVGVPERV